MIQSPRALISAARQIQVSDRDAAAQGQELRKHVSHGPCVIIAALTAAGNKIRIQLLEHRPRERLAQSFQKEAVQIEMALSPPNVCHDKNTQPW